MTPSRTAATFAPPVMEARRWLEGVSFPPGRPLLNVSQAAPVDPPPLEMRQAMAEFALQEDSAHLYGPVLGNADIRAELAAQIGRHYAAQVEAHQIAITSGCNQAFSAVISALTDQADEVILPTPWYFNHKMWLDMSGVRTVPAANVGDRSAARSRSSAAALIGPRKPAPSSLVSPKQSLWGRVPGRADGAGILRARPRTRASG